MIKPPCPRPYVTILYLEMATPTARGRQAAAVKVEALAAEGEPEVAATGTRVVEGAAGAVRAVLVVEATAAMVLSLMVEAVVPGKGVGMRAAEGLGVAGAGEKVAMETVAPAATVKGAQANAAGQGCR